MPTVIHMLVEVSVPVPDKDAIAQMVVTQALTAATDAIKQVVAAREGAITVSAQVKKVRGPEPEARVVEAPDPLGGPHSAPGNTPETMPVELPT